MNSGIIIGNWNGSIDILGNQLEVNVQFTQESDFLGSISIPAQNLSDFPLVNIKLEDTNIYFEMPIPNQQITFSGKIDEDQIEGLFVQHGQSFPFQLIKAEGTPTQNGSNLEDSETFLTIDTEHGKLYGSLVLPEGDTRCPVVLIIPGSGPTDRDGNSVLLPGKNNSLKMLAQALAEHGIASLRYDKRGAGKNAQAVPPEIDTRFDLFIHDATQWVNTLKNDSRFTKVGVIGHSEGSLVGMVAAKLAGADSYVSIAGAGRPINEVLKEQLAGAPEELRGLIHTILANLTTGKTTDEIDEKLAHLFRPSVQPYLISWIKYDPTEEIAKLDIPVLIINGTHDIQVAVKDAQRLKAAKDDASLLIIENMNHVFKEAPADPQENIKTYSDPSLPLANGFVEGLIKFYKNSLVKN
ncbi:alpha/beta hydrolase [Neobacillus dielmonensis]|uniref:alpha/beta hydrolase n=1 Tax=Neobacillus dielmonensis TaxID=1347369 RepID=UPI0009448768|nr:alpha/beta fold hydrolase [Neobacillus dielmonensis]